MKAIKYKARITVDQAHGWTSDIDEIFIPGLNVAFNSEGGFFYCETDDLQNRITPDLKIENIEIDDNEALSVYNAVVAKLDTMEIINKTFKKEG